MIPGHSYTGMMVTGFLHCPLGVIQVILAIIGLNEGAKLRNDYVGAFLIGIYVCLVGGLGIAAGTRKLADETIRKLKIGYMVTAILSATVFYGIACWIYARSINIARQNWIQQIYDLDDVYQLTSNQRNYIIYGRIGMTVSFFEFVLAIVSSSICCCCSSTTAPTTVVVQSAPQQVVTSIPGQSTIQYVYPPNQTIQYQQQPINAMQYQQPPNTVMQFQTYGNGVVLNAPPPAYTQSDYPSKANQ